MNQTKHNKTLATEDLQARIEADDIVNDIGSPSFNNVDDLMKDLLSGIEGFTEDFESEGRLEIPTSREDI